MRFASEKVRDAFVARAWRETKAELQFLNEEIANLEKQYHKREAVIHEIDAMKEKKEAPVSSFGYAYNRVIRNNIVAMKKLHRQNQREIYDARKKVVPRERLLLIAQSIYTRGMSKVLTREYNELLKERRALESDLAAFRRIAPGQRQALHGVQWFALQQRQEQLASREAVNQKQVRLMQEKLNLPVARQRIAKLINALENKNEIRRRRVARLQEVNEKLNRQIERLQVRSDQMDIEIRDAFINKELQNADAENKLLDADKQIYAQKGLDRDITMQVIDATKDSKKLPVIAYGREFIQIINDHIERMQEDLHRRDIHIRYLQRGVLSSQKMELIAQSVFTKGRSKVLTREYNALMRERQDIGRIIRQAIIQRHGDSAREILDSDGELREWQNRLKQRETINQKQIAYLKTVLEQPESKRQIGRMIAALEKKVEVRKLRIAHAAEVRKLRIAHAAADKVKIAAQIEKLFAIRREIGDEMREQRFLIDAGTLSQNHSVEQIIHECSGITNQFRAAVVKAQSGVRGKKHAIQAKLYKQGNSQKQDEYDYGRD